MRRFMIAGVLVTLVLAGIVSFYASSSPDGLEYVAEKHGFLERAQDHPLADSPVADYGVRGVENERVSGGLAGVAGVAVTLVLAGGLFWVVRRRGQ
ncbi:PDGLE domain-containing protein [Bailinhaonella thermotolerans]|uniref:PDGLE domain-containing protein n=1 Tax=Bailinhaonella thermotolerans TaxID=1070861 RepID=UPI001F5B5663|nr:PDGLE domain-containing protein [Bailinhaonella thermotolerans]